MSNKNNEIAGVKPFWEKKSLIEMTSQEWESLCDGCGRCCLNKLEDWDTGQIYWTNIACELLDGDTCRCKNYQNRFDTVPDCIQLTPQKIDELHWLPPTCAYRLVNEGKPLYDWHPLVSGSHESIHDAGISIKGRTVPEKNLTPENYEDYLVDWPLEMPAEAADK